MIGSSVITLSFFLFFFFFFLQKFDVDQAAFLARVGYVGLAVDLYPETEDYAASDRNPPLGASVMSPGDDAARRHFKGAFAAMGRLLQNPKDWRRLMGYFLEAAREHHAVHPRLAAAIGYCLGGQSVLEQVRAGHDLQAVVSFHGLLQSRPGLKGDLFMKTRMTPEEFAAEVDCAENHYSAGCKVLIENGDEDDRVQAASIQEWKEEMDEHHIDWQFNNHSQTPHCFALGQGVWSSKYTEHADRRSTLSMLRLFAEVFPTFPQHPVVCNAAGTTLGQYISVGAAKL